MVNHELTKRMVVDLLCGGRAGWAPWYSFYMGAGSQIGLRTATVPDSKDVTAATASGQFVGGPRHRDYWNSLDTPGITSVGGRTRFDPALRTRVHDGVATPTIGNKVPTQGDRPGLHHTAVVQNWYMYQAYNNDPKTDARTPYVFADVDPSVMLDPVVATFSYETELSLELKPNITLGAKLEPQLSESVAALISSKSAYSVGSTAMYQDSCTFMPSISSNPGYAVSRDPYRTTNAFTSAIYRPSGNPYDLTTFRLVQTKSFLDVTDPSKLMRFCSLAHCANTSNGVQTLKNPNPDTLLAGVTTDIEDNTNAQFLVMESSVMNAHKSVVSYMSWNASSLAPGLKPVQVAPWYRPSMHLRGWSNDTSGVVTTASTARAPMRVEDIILPVQAGLPGLAKYRVERYVRSFIEYSLTNHLPHLTPSGTKAEYFTRGVFMPRPDGYSNGAYGDSAYNGDEQINAMSYVQQPVAFPAAQAPEDPWLYYVSMDEDYNYWLNRQELGKAHVSEALCALVTPPTQMVVINNKVWLSYPRSVAVFDITSKSLTKYQTGLPTAMTSVAADREKSKVYIGHTGGVFDFTTCARVDIDLGSLTVDKRVVGETRLRAVNGYLTWVTVADDQQSGDVYNSYLCWASIADSVVLSWDICEFTGKRDFRAYSYNNTQRTWGFLASDLRSNGDLVVMHNSASGNSQGPNHELTWAKVNINGSIRRMFTRLHYWAGALGNDASVSSYVDGVKSRTCLYRIDDLHYSALNVVHSVARRSSYITTAGAAESRNTSYMGRGYYAGKVYAKDFRIDDEKQFILVQLSKKPTPIGNTSQYNQSADYSGNVSWLNVEEPNWWLPTFQGVETRPCDMKHAVNSGCVVILNRGYATLFCGLQGSSQLGVELSWSGSEWVPGVAGRPLVARTTHADAQALNPWATAAFSATVPLTYASVYRSVSFPSCVRPKKPWYIYAGDLIEGNVFTGTVAAAMPIPPAEKGYGYIGIENTRADALSCVLDGTTTLTFVPPGSSPSATQFCITGESLVLHSSHIGKAVELHYAYVRAAT